MPIMMRSFSAKRGVDVHRRAASRQTEPPHSRRVTAETVFCDNCVYWTVVGDPVTHYCDTRRRVTAPVSQVSQVSQG
jgi:C4-type Zn-finger protein